MAAYPRRTAGGQHARRRHPAPDGGRANEAQRWSWGATLPNDLPSAATTRWHKRPGVASADYEVFGMSCDRSGGLTFADRNTQIIWRIPARLPRLPGAPLWDWVDAIAAVPADTSPLGFQPTCAHRADDGSIWAFGWSKPWPKPNSTPFWMGGTTLVCFSAEGRQLWAKSLPSPATGLDVLPGGGGACVGLGQSGQILHVDDDGVTVATLTPGPASGGITGLLDNQASVSLQRDPRDGLIDLFVEDDSALRVNWYRFDDHKLVRHGGAIDLVAP